MDLKYTANNGEVLHFVVQRLLNYKRINYDLLVETVRLKFERPDADELLNSALIETRAAYIQNEHLMVSDKDLLASLEAAN